mmetsp:Transcript_1651/g.3642  ORF Transcript_1651/g.3642 Transcript_1651/m.3642 type:complete len:81 (-) Transcript_1651:795-1037(-)
MGFVQEVENKSPAWLCIVKPAFSEAPAFGKQKIDCSELLREFEDVQADPAFPEKRAVEHAIDIFPGSAPQMGPIFRLAPC